MKNRIFVSTNATLYDIFGERKYNYLQEILKNCGLDILRNENIERVYLNGSKFDLDFIDSDIIIVKDSSNSPLTESKPQTDFLLYHSQTKQSVIDSFKGRKIQGSHSSLYYLDAFQIIFDNLDNKAERIIDKLFSRKKEYTDLIRELTIEMITSKNDLEYKEFSEKSSISKNLNSIIKFIKTKNETFLKNMQALLEIKDINEFYIKFKSLDPEIQKIIFDDSENNFE